MSGGGILEMVMDKIKPMFDEKIDEAKKEILDEMKKLEELIKENRR